MGVKLRAITRTIRRRTGEAKSEVLKLTEQTGELLEQSIKEARRLAAIARRRARGRDAKAKLKAAASLEEMADRCEKVAGQIRQRVKGEPIKDRIVSLADPDARPILKGKLGKPNLVSRAVNSLEKSCELGEDLLSGLRPDKRLGVLVPGCDPAADVGLERLHAAVV